MSRAHCSKIVLAASQQRELAAGRSGVLRDRPIDRPTAPSEKIKSHKYIGLQSPTIGQVAIGHVIGQTAIVQGLSSPYSPFSMATRSAKRPVAAVETETLFRIEPTLVDEVPGELNDVVAELAAASSKLGASLHPTTAASLADLVRIMNTYYSNLIEGHNTRPRDIVRALAGDFVRDQERRNLQLEAASHVRVQREIDRKGALGELGEPAAAEFIRELHREFYRDAPEAMLRINADRRSFLMVPGEWRSRPDEDNVVGRHVPAASARIPEFMARFGERYSLGKMRQGARILAIPTSHHRFNYIHPFPGWQRPGQSAHEPRHGILCRHRRAWSLVDLARTRARSKESRRVQDDDGSGRRAARGRS